MTAKAEITVAAISEHEGRFLFIEERSAGRLVINQPAGHLEADESLVDAVVRETLEESGYHFVPASLCSIYVWRHPRTGANVMRLNFVGETHSHDPQRPLDEGIVRSLWLDRAQLVAQRDRLRNPMVLRAVDDYLAGKRYPLDLLDSVDEDWQIRSRTG